jgi:nitrate reductase gamma subunit
MSLLIIWLYAAGAIFLIGSAVRAICYARQPIHLRWELYPIPHGRTGELKVMIPEILFLKALREFNRPMWFVSYPFHLGLYLLSAAIVLLAAAAFLPAWTPLLGPLYAYGGLAGAVFGLAGSLGLLLRRLTDPALRPYSTAGDSLNLAWFAVTFVLLIAGVLLRPPGSPGPLEIARAAARFDTSLKPPGLLAAGILSGAALLAYIPMTHMAHFIGKYFTYHAIRWDERTAAPGGVIERRMAEYLTYRPSWSAPHIGAGGRTWAEIATTNPTQGEGARK